MRRVSRHGLAATVKCVDVGTIGAMTPKCQAPAGASCAIYMHVTSNNSVLISHQSTSTSTVSIPVSTVSSAHFRAAVVDLARDSAPLKTPIPILRSFLSAKTHTASLRSGNPLCVIFCTEWSFSELVIFSRFTRFISIYCGVCKEQLSHCCVDAFICYIIQYIYSSSGSVSTNHKLVWKPPPTLYRPHHAFLWLCPSVNFHWEIICACIFMIVCRSVR